MIMIIYCCCVDALSLSLSRVHASLHVPEEHAELPHGHGLLEHGHGTVAFRTAQQVHRALLDHLVFAAATVVFAAAALQHRRPSSARGTLRFRRRRPDVRARVERRRRVERQRLGRRRSVHLAHFERVVAVLQQTVRRAVQLHVVACVHKQKRMSTVYFVKTA